MAGIEIARAYKGASGWFTVKLAGKHVGDVVRQPSGVWSVSRQVFDKTDPEAGKEITRCVTKEEAFEAARLHFGGDKASHEQAHRQKARAQDGRYEPYQTCEECKKRKALHVYSTWHLGYGKYTERLVCARCAVANERSDPRFKD